MENKIRLAVGVLTMSVAGFASWAASEGFTDKAVIPTKGDVPTLGHGSTRYEDGRKVKMGDTITRPRAKELARNLMVEDEAKLRVAIPGAKLTQNEWDAYVDFIGQYGIGNFRGSTMQREILRQNYVAACQGLLKYKYAAGYDCSTPGNKRCYGVWTRQVARYNTCLGK